MITKSSKLSSSKPNLIRLVHSGSLLVHFITVCFCLRFFCDFLNETQWMFHFNFSSDSSDDNWVSFCDGNNFRLIESECVTLYLTNRYGHSTPTTVYGKLFTMVGETLIKTEYDDDDDDERRNDTTCDHILSQSSAFWQFNSVCSSVMRWLEFHWDWSCSKVLAKESIDWVGKYRKLNAVC